MNSKEYISKLRSLRFYSRWINRNIDSAVDSMRDRLDNCSNIDEVKCRLELGSCRVNVNILLEKIRELESCSIEY